MFGQTIKSNSGGRGRKKGYELPGHKWIKRIPNGKGGWRYIYDKAVGGVTYANRVAKAGVDRAFNSRMPNYAHVLRPQCAIRPPCLSSLNSSNKSN